MVDQVPFSAQQRAQASIPEPWALNRKFPKPIMQDIVCRPKRWLLAALGGTGLSQHPTGSSLGDLELADQMVDGSPALGWA